MKLFVETTAAFSIVDPTFNQTIGAFAPSVVTMTGLIETMLARKQLHKVSDLKEEATEEEFQKFLRESKADNKDEKGKTKDEKKNELAVAVDSFLSKFGDGDAEDSIKVALAEDDEDTANAVIQKLDQDAADERAEQERYQAQVKQDQSGGKPVATTSSTSSATPEVTQTPPVQAKAQNRTANTGATKTTPAA